MSATTDDTSRPVHLTARFAQIDRVQPPLETPELPAPGQGRIGLDHFEERDFSIPQCQAISVEVGVLREAVEAKKPQALQKL